MERVQFLFGTEMFEQSVKKVSKLFNSIEKVAEKTAKGIDKEFNKAAKDITKLPGAIGKSFSLLGKGFGDVRDKIFGKRKAAAATEPSPVAEKVGKAASGGGGLGEMMGGGLTKLLGPLAAVGAGLFSISTIMKGIPEIGETFAIAGSIIMRNFFEPLRKEILPILQKILNWVTAHRTDFVKWGSVLVNVFRTVLTAAKVLYTFLSGAVAGLFQGLSKYFGASTKNIEDLFNLLLLKVTVILLFLEPYIKKIGEVIGSLLEALVGFYKNYIEAYLGGRFFKLIKEIVGALGELWTAITNINVLGVTLGDVFNKVGLIIGSVVGVAFENLLITLKTVLKVATDLINLDFKKLGSDIVGAGKDIAGNYLGRGKTIFNAVTQKQSKVEDAIVKSDGSIIHTSPSDTIIATKNTPMVNPGMGGAGGAPVSIGSIVGQIILSVTEGNAKNAGQNFADGLSDKIRAILRKEMAVSGAY